MKDAAIWMILGGNMKLSEIARDIQAIKCTGEADITGLCTDSRVAGKGDLFFCFCGTQTDSHHFAEEAEKRGAAAVMCERELPLGIAQIVVKDGRKGMAEASAAFYAHPERKMKIVGVTGTNGKTTTAHMIRNILDACGRKTGLIGTLGASYAGRFIPPKLTTPDPVFLFSLLADMKKAGVDTVVMEVSAHALALCKECPIVYEVGVFTNLTRDHLDFFGDMKDYGDAKKKMFDPARCRFAVLNADDGFSVGLKKICASHITYGMESPADAFAVIREENLRETNLILNVNDELCETRLCMTGGHNVMNALAAACAAKRLGADGDAISRGIAETKSVDGRLEWTASFRGADIFVDFAHTPDGLEKSLTALKKHCAGRLIALFGCGGNRDAGKRAEMGERAAKLCDFCVITSDNPRYEDPCAIISEIERAFRAVSSAYVAVEEREKGIEYAVGILKKGDVLLVAGKGGETYQEIMGIKYDYNDKAVIGKAISKLS